MNEYACDCDKCNNGKIWVGLFSRIWYPVKRWIFLYVWCRYLYRPVMKVAHRYNWHYAPPSDLSPIYGERHHWCQWCGLRGTTYKINPENSVLKNV